MKVSALGFMTFMKNIIGNAYCIPGINVMWISVVK